MKDFLRKESKKWVDSEIITQEQLNKIHDLYPASKTNSLIVVFAIIGSVLIGTGIILIFASNWWSIPIFIRAVLAFIPLLLAQAIGIYCYLKQKLTTAFREGIGLFLMFAIFANIALIGQIFHTSSDVYTYMGVCFLLSLPSIYFFGSFAVFIAYMTGTTAITVFAITKLSTLGTFLLPVILITAILPFIIFTLKKDLSRVKENLILTLSASVTTAFLIFLTGFVNEGFWQRTERFLSYITLSDFLISAPLLLIAVDGFYNYWKKKSVMTSFKFFGITIQSFVLISSVFDTFLFYDGAGGILFLIISVIIYLAPKALRKQGFVGTDSITIATIFLLLWQIFLPFDIIIVSIVVFLLGIYFIYLGSKQLTFRHLNYGLLLTFGVISVRFFSSDLSILLRGIIFLVLGIAFLLINLRLSKKRKELVE